MHHVLVIKLLSEDNRIILKKGAGVHIVFVWFHGQLILTGSQDHSSQFLAVLRLVACNDYALLSLTDSQWNNPKLVAGIYVKNAAI